jgi:L,D-peptidoglycan transpeptidase YkuD (ErfK/YbiS/YcfS/YnhG family)
VLDLRHEGWRVGNHTAMRVLAIAAAALVCPPNVPAAAQVVTVRAPAHSTVATLEVWDRCRRVMGPWTARVGAAGLSVHKREGDGATPTGTYRFGSTVYGIEPDPRVRLLYHRLACGDWWDSDPRSATYNRFRHVACGTSLVGEALWRIYPQYRYFAEIRYNASPVVPRRGSAIFLHVSAGRPTAGCVALPEAQLLRLLRWLRPGALVHLGIS